MNIGNMSQCFSSGCDFVTNRDHSYFHIAIDTVFLVLFCFLIN